MTLHAAPGFPAANLSFKHSGDLGDIIYALPVVKALGGGILCLDPTGGGNDPYVSEQSTRGRCKFDRAGYEFLRPLLVEQPYIKDVVLWEGQAVTHNLNAVRAAMNDRRTNLSVLYARVFSVDPAVADIPWLTLQSPPLALGKRFIINRTLRYQAKYHWWEINHPALVADGIFVGLEKEHEVFEYTFRCKIPFHKAQDALEIARILADAEMLIGNQSLVMSLAVGLGTAYSQEVYDAAPNCIFKRSNARYF